MSFIVMKFRIPEEQDELYYAQHGIDYHSALWSLDQEVLRPVVKHGYPEEKLRKLLESIDSTDTQEDKYTSLVEAVYNEIRAELHQAVHDQNVLL